MPKSPKRCNQPDNSNACRQRLLPITSQRSSLAETWATSNLEDFEIYRRMRLAEELRDQPRKELLFGVVGEKRVSRIACQGGTESSEDNADSSRSEPYPLSLGIMLSILKPRSC